MLISFACMSEKVPGESVCLSPGGGPVCGCGAELGWAYLGSQALSLGGNLGSPILLFCLSVFLGGLGFAPHAFSTATPPRLKVG